MRAEYWQICCPLAKGIVSDIGATISFIVSGYISQFVKGSFMEWMQYTSIKLAHRSDKTWLFSLEYSYWSILRVHARCSQHQTNDLSFNLKQLHVRTLVDICIFNFTMSLHPRYNNNIRKKLFANCFNIDTKRTEIWKKFTCQKNT